ARAELLRAKAHEHVVWKPEVNEEVVPTVTESARPQPAGAVGTKRVLVEEPGGHVDGVNVLLGDNIAGERPAHAPGAQTALGVGGINLQHIELPGPRRAGDVGCLAADDPPDVALLHAADGFLVEGVRAR